ncbi:MULTISPECIES: hypothetical protein [Paenibacillus]|uniref:hypothetical protein n=1 Tax=Paenibacillus TaxID=44249 RepID=UPI0022B8E4C7|nr:hypothetical protein [Paenibacillus caseinilyticus]MCZ8523052.1 hypothetical protein [Paenibacillus caseinilyticus]
MIKRKFRKSIASLAILSTFSLANLNGSAYVGELAETLQEKGEEITQGKAISKEDMEKK